MEMSKPMSSSSDHEDYVDQSSGSIGVDFDRLLKLDCNGNGNDDDEDDSTSQQLLPDLDLHEDCEDEEDDEDFTFMYIGDDDSLISEDKVLEEGQIRTVFPLFDQKLLLSGEYDVEEIDRCGPQVDNVFVESPHRSTSSMASEHEQNDTVEAGPYCDWSKQSAELSKKSNSTGFSKLWRLKEKVGRSNSDGRDAFVFLKHPVATTATATTTSSSSSSPAKAVAGEGAFVKVNVAGGKPTVVRKGTPVKKAKVSAHEAYMRSKVGHTEDERRRSYLPYRPELMGFFTNVNGGLSKNVHPY